jgi:cytochrome c-type biogenesis protein CcmF
VAAGTGAMAGLVVLGLRDGGALITFGLAAFVLTVSVGRVWADIGSRRRSTREPWGRATQRLLVANPRRYGGYLAHIGVLLMVIGIAASQTYQVRAIGTLRPGQSLRIDDYRVTYLGLHSRPEPSRMVLETPLVVRRGGRTLGILHPSQNVYPQMEQPIVTPAVREEPWDMILGLARGTSPLPDLRQMVQGHNPFEDLYVVPLAINNVDASTFKASRSGSVTVQVLVNPLVGFIWLGGVVVGLGGFLALLPGRRRRTARALAPAVRRQAEEVPA